METYQGLSKPDPSGTPSPEFGAGTDWKLAIAHAENSVIKSVATIIYGYQWLLKIISSHKH
ncbi:MAG: hypothetical protein SVJ22_11050 [Halobacteriota archaeon]|nr:hypothetical protein [Halobacteriota archaeon]